MKNHIAFKFLAVVLCALTLLMAVGSGLGIAVLMSADLYNQSVDTFRQERIQSDCKEYAQSIAFRYASIRLGGCPEDMLSDYSSDYWFYDVYNALSVGYRLLDADGNVLDSRPLERVQDADTYVVSADGVYMQLLTVKPLSEWEDQEKNRVFPGIDANDGTHVYDAVPNEGAMVYQVHFYNTEGAEIYGMEESDPIGYIFRNQSGSVVFRTTFSDNLMLPDTVISGAIFCDEYGKLIFEAFSADGIGRLYHNDEGSLMFTCSVSQTEEVEAAESDFTIYDAIPEEGTEVSNLSVSFADGRSTGVGSDEGIGMLSVDAFGNVTFHPYYPELLDLPESAMVTHIVFQNENEELVYEAACEDGVGTLRRNEQGDYVFSSDVFSYREESALTEIPETMEADGLESASEETAEQTVPETAALPKTVPVTTEAGIAAAAATVSSPDTAEDESVPVLPDTVTAGTAPEAEMAIPEDTGDADVIASTETWAAMSESDEAVYSDRNPSSLCYYDSKNGEQMYAEFNFTEMPDYTVEMVLGPDAFRYESAYSMLALVWQFRNALFIVLGVSLLVFAALAVYLCSAAGRKPGADTVHAGGVNCVPLDIYLVAAGLGIAGIIYLIAESADYLLQQNLLISCILMGTAGYTCCLFFVGFSFAFAAQVKTPGAYWWRNSLCGRCLKLLGKILRGLWMGCLWLKKKAPKFLSGLWSFIKRFFAKFWILVCWLFHYVKRHIWNVCRLLKKGTSWAGRKLARFYGMLPLTWQWLLTGMILLVLLFVAIATRSEVMLALCLCGCVAIVLYGASAFGTLLESAKRMSKGDLEIKVEDKYLIGSFKDFAGELNALAGVAVVAAQKQLKSERMKTELITNVSHDIKTPLTSIINYVDLMQKAHTPEEQEMYLEVLARQSQRLKKLIEDLIEMSKASTGNLQVDIIQINAAEAINQALGEFADKLEAAQLTPVFRQPEETVIMMADGRLVWRVMSNLLSNAVKYALPGTRLYVDLMKLDGKVVISMKNISREELNVSVDELLERFVRGDAARNTEGSGLGLNIAQSLMELQKGQLQLMVDGDLFKVTLIFPGT